MEKNFLINLCINENNSLLKLKDDKIKIAMCIARYSAYSSFLLIYFNFNIEKCCNYDEIIKGAEIILYEK